jgi:hypothetical protein
MPMMSFSRRTWLAVVVTLLCVCIGVANALAYYDLRTEKKVYGLIERELPQHASMNVMDAFMKRHTGNLYSLDEKYNFEFVGMFPQTDIDRILFDRRVEIVLKIDRKTNTLQRSDVEVTYTFL